MNAAVGVFGLVVLLAAGVSAGWRLSNANHFLNRLIADDRPAAVLDDGPPL